MDTTEHIHILMDDDPEAEIEATELHPMVPDLENPITEDFQLDTEYTTRKRSIHINRPLMKTNDLTQSCLIAASASKEEPSLYTKLSLNARKCCSGISFSTLLLSFVPVLSWLPKYNFRGDIVRDLSGGLTVGIMQIPQGLAYGMLTTLPAIHGLYTSVLPVLIYFVFGTSRHLSMGTFAIVVLMLGEVLENKVGPLVPNLIQTSNGTSIEQQVIDLRIEYAVTLSFLVGAFQIVCRLFRFGFITIFLSDALISGFTTGAAFHIFSSQVKNLVGMKIPRNEVGGFFALFKLYIYIFKNITQVNIGSLIIGLVAAPLIYAIKFLAQKYKDELRGFPIPAELIVVILGTGLSYGFDFNTKYDIPVLKDVPTGMPPITVPSFSMMASAMTIVDAVSIAIVSYAISVSIAKLFAKKNNYRIDANQELFAHGVMNIVGSFFSCHVASSSMSRSLLQESLGRTQLTSLFSCGLVILVLTVLAPWFEPLPKAILAAIILNALKRLFLQFSMVKRLVKVGKVDAFVWISTFIAVICLGLDYGLAIGFVINLLSTVGRTTLPSAAVLSHVEDTEIYTSLSPTNQISLQKIPGVTIFQFHAPLLYINVDRFQEAVFKASVNPSMCIKVNIPECFQPERQGEQATNGTGLNGSALKQSDYLDASQVMNGKGIKGDVSLEKASTCPLHTVVLDCSQISYADTMGTGVLVSVCSEFQKVGVDVLLCDTPAQLLTALQLGGFVEAHGAENLFVSVHDAVQFALAKKHVVGVCKLGMEQSDENDPQV